MLDEQNGKSYVAGQGCVNSATPDPVVSIPRSALRTALRLAENAVDEIQARVLDAQMRRDARLREAAAAQEEVDRLRGELDYRTRHVRELEAAAKP